jgi:hypothetical protein
MATLLHQAALPTAKPNPWALNSTAGLSPLHEALALLPRRRRAPAAIRSAATDGSSISTDAAPPSNKKKTRKEKQLDRSRQQDMQHRQRQLLMQASVPKANGGGGKQDEYDDDELPQPVFDRILGRILVTVGLPMASGVALLNVYEALKSNQGVELPSWLSLLTILVSFGTSALGIAYGTLSASWDPEKEGSLLGIEELQANWPVLWAEEIEKEKAKARKKK